MEYEVKLDKAELYIIDFALGHEIKRCRELGHNADDNYYVDRAIICHKIKAKLDLIKGKGVNNASNKVI